MSSSCYLACVTLLLASCAVSSQTVAPTTIKTTPVPIVYKCLTCQHEAWTGTTRQPVTNATYFAAYKGWKDNKNCMDLPSGHNISTETCPLGDKGACVIHKVKMHLTHNAESYDVEFISRHCMQVSKVDPEKKCTEFTDVNNTTNLSPWMQSKYTLMATAGFKATVKGKWCYCNNKSECNAGIALGSSVYSMVAAVAAVWALWFRA